MDEWTGSKTSPAVRVSILSIKTCPFVFILSIASIVSLSIKKRDIFRCDWENENALAASFL